MAKAHPCWMNPTQRNSAVAGYRNWRRRRQPRTDARRLCRGCAAGAVSGLPTPRPRRFRSLRRCEPNGASFSALFFPHFPPKPRSGNKTDSQLRLLAPLKHCWPFFHGTAANGHVS